MQGCLGSKSDCLIDNKSNIYELQSGIALREKDLKKFHLTGMQIHTFKMDANNFCLI